jgi:hypothetical protein
MPRSRSVDLSTMTFNPAVPWNPVEHDSYTDTTLTSQWGHISCTLLSVSDSYKENLTSITISLPNGTIFTYCLGGSKIKTTCMLYIYSQTKRTNMLILFPATAMCWHLLARNRIVSWLWCACCHLFTKYLIRSLLCNCRGHKKPHLGVS